MTSYCLRPPMRWSEAIGAIAKCKRVCTGSAVRLVERAVLPWTCSENRVPKVAPKPLRRYTRRAGDLHDPESLLQCPIMEVYPNRLAHQRAGEHRRLLRPQPQRPVQIQGPKSPLEPLLQRE